MAGSYDPKADPLAQRAHALYLQIIEHLPECPACKRFKFIPVDGTIALAVGPRGMSREDAFKLFCPAAQTLVRVYNIAMGNWLDSLDSSP